MTTRLKLSAADQKRVEDTQSLAGIFVDLVDEVGDGELVCDAMIIATAHLIVGKTSSAEQRIEIVKAIKTFIDSLYDCRDVLRENATNMQRAPGKVM